MDKKQFRDLVIPLNEREKLYREEPARAGECFNDWPKAKQDADGVYRFDFCDVLTSDLATKQEHGQIVSTRPNGQPYREVLFNKQTRFSQVPPHRHNYLELFYVYEGQCAATINGQSLSLQKGDVCIMDTGVVHVIDPTGEKDIVLNCLFEQKYFNAQLIGRLASSGTLAQFLAGVLSDSAVHNRYLLFHTNDMLLVRDLFEDAFCEYLDPGVCSDDMLDSLMTMLFIQLARCYQQTKEQEYREDSRSYITEVLRYLETHFADCTLADTAARFGFNPDYLSRLLKRATGFSFKELVDQNRLRQAAFLLLNPNQAIADIAAQCGWSNLNQFYKKFKEGYGESPREYRLRTVSELP